MTRTLSMAELKAHLSEVVGEVQHTGGEVVIKKHGKPVVKIVRVSAEEAPKGLLGFVGAFDDSPEFANALDEIVRSRRKDKFRKVPRLK